MAENKLYYGDNLDILRRYIADESVDLVYLDPPFKSDQDYNVLFAEQDGTRSAAQIRAFQDTWRWDEGAVAAFEEAVRSDGRVAATMQAFHTMLGASDMLAYLSYMAPRLVQLRRVLKETGSIYLHCDPTASHYLKLLMDSVFSPINFKAEIVWKRTDAHNDAKQGGKKFGRVHDIILYYSKSKDFVWNHQYLPLPETTIEKWYRNVEEKTGRRYNKADLTAARPGGDTKYRWKGVLPPEGRYWAYSKKNMEKLEKEGRIVYSSSGRPYMKRYLDESRGVPLQDMWVDISMVRGIGKERLGYPTQKPLALLERIIGASSNEGDIVLDPFCGCGTAIDAAQKLNRRWVGIDITHLAITLIKHRLHSAYGSAVAFDVIGEPVDQAGAKDLAAADPWQFQWWALGLVDARPVEQKKGADKGVDGRLFFRDQEKGGLKQIVISVKAGTTGPAHVRELRGVVEREGAAIGLLITMQDFTRKMREEAADAGFYESPGGTRHPRLQLRTVAELLEGQGLDYPRYAENVTFKKAPKAQLGGHTNEKLFN
ncbi:MAG: DNA methyltransferase [Thermodesulfobacteriota bacterium]